MSTGPLKLRLRNRVNQVNARETICRPFALRAQVSAVRSLRIALPDTNPGSQQYGSNVAHSGEGFSHFLGNQQHVSVCPGYIL